jgi:hypothetical protein
MLTSGETRSAALELPPLDASLAGARLTCVARKGDIVLNSTSVHLEVNRTFFSFCSFSLSHTFFHSLLEIREANQINCDLGRVDHRLRSASFSRISIYSVEIDLFTSHLFVFCHC